MTPEEQAAENQKIADESCERCGNIPPEAGLFIVIFFLFVIEGIIIWAKGL